MKKAFLLFLSVSLAGCNGILNLITNPEQFPGRSTVLSSFPAPAAFVGTATQWTSEYAVTAAHTPFISNVVHKCSTGCDLVFIKKNSSGVVPQWRDPVPGEIVFSAGTNVAYMPVYGHGKFSDTLMEINNYDFPFPLSVHSAPVTSGMSGGPIYGRDGKILGINLGRAKGVKFSGPQTTYSAAHLERMSLAIPYAQIAKEWDIFMQQQAAKLGDQEGAG